MFRSYRLCCYDEYNYYGMSKLCNAQQCIFTLIELMCMIQNSNSYSWWWEMLQNVPDFLLGYHYACISNCFYLNLIVNN